MKPTRTWRLLLSMAGYRPWLYLLHGTLWATVMMSSLLPGLIALAFFDALTGQAHVPVGAAGLVVLLAALAVLRAAQWLAAGYVEIVMRFTMSALLRRNLLRHVLGRPGALPLPHSIGETLSRFRDDAHQAEDNLDWSDEILGHGLCALAAFAVLLRIDALMAAVAVLPLVAVAATAARANTVLGRYRAASSRATSEVAGAIGDILSAVPAIQAAGAEERVVGRLRRLNERRRAAVVADQLATAALGTIAGNAVSLSTGLIMLLGAGALRGGRLTIGDFVLFVSWLGFIANFTSSIGQYANSHRQTGVAFARMGELLDGAPLAELVAHAPLGLGPRPEAAAPARREAGVAAVARGTGGEPEPAAAWPGNRQGGEPAAGGPGNRRGPEPAAVGTGNRRGGEPAAVRPGNRREERRPLTEPRAARRAEGDPEGPAAGAGGTGGLASRGAGGAAEARLIDGPLAVLEARGLTCRHPQSGRGITGVDLRLARGTLTVVTGRVGAGKTTLLRALLGLLPREGGEIRWNGAVVEDAAAFFAPPRAAYTAQDPRLFSDTLKRNILLGRPDDPEVLAAALRAAVLEPDVRALEDGLETAVGARGVKLSGGQVRRAAAARMWVRGAELLVIDDLSSALDVETERAVWEGLLAGGGPTCLAVSHRRAALARADRVVVLREGRVEAEGSLDAVLAGCAEMRALWEEG